MKITEKALLDGYTGITSCGEMVSILPIGKYGENQTVYWEYGVRKQDGLYGVRFRKDSEIIRIEIGMYGKIVTIDTPKKCMNKAMNEKIQKDISDTILSWKNGDINDRI